MGYTTEFRGAFKVEPPVTNALMQQINGFSEERHGGNTKPHAGMPGFWCDWHMPTNDSLCWNGSEKFYSYTEWLQLVIDKFLKPAGHTVSGSVEWRGEEFTDTGTLEVTGNKARAKARV